MKVIIELSTFATVNGQETDIEVTSRIAIEVDHEGEYRIPNDLDATQHTAVERAMDHFMETWEAPEPCPDDHYERERDDR